MTWVRKGINWGHAETSEAVRKLGYTWAVSEPVSGDEDAIGEPDGETGGDARVGYKKVKRSFKNSLTIS